MLFFFVLFIAIFYKFSFTMLAYLGLFLMYYYYLHHYFNELISKIPPRVQEKLVRWKQNFIVNVEKDGIFCRSEPDEDEQLSTTFSVEYF